MDGQTDRQVEDEAKTMEDEAKTGNPIKAEKPREGRRKETQKEDGLLLLPSRSSRVRLCVTP